MVVECVARMIVKIAHAALAMNPTIPRISPASARPPPPTVPALAAIRWREMNPMIAAAGPRMMPRHSGQKHTNDRMPAMRAPIARPSVRRPATAAPA